MKKFKKIKAYNKKYIKQLDHSLHLVEPYLIQAFTLFYGEEYLKQIEYTIKHIRYSFFLSETFFSLLAEQSFGIRKKDKSVAQYYLKYLRSFGLKVKGIDDLDRLEKLILKTLVTYSDFDQDQLVYSNCLAFLSDDVPIYSIICDDEDESFYKAIFLPVFVITFEVIIHEINHALMLDVMAVANKKVVMPQLFITEECEELFNDYIAYLVLEQYIGLKAPIPYALRKFTFVNNYEPFFYLIETFYDIFEPIIKKSIMTKNFNLLWKYTGEEDFNLFCSLVQKYCRQNGCTDEEFDLLRKLVFKMKEHAACVSNISYEDYFQELKDQGYQIRILHK